MRGQIVGQVECSKPDTKQASSYWRMPIEHFLSLGERIEVRGQNRERNVVKRRGIAQPYDYRDVGGWKRREHVSQRIVRPQGEQNSLSYWRMPVSSEIRPTQRVDIIGTVKLVKFGA